MNKMLIILAVAFVLYCIYTLNLKKDELAENYIANYSKFLTKRQYDIIVCFALSILAVLFTAGFWAIAAIIAQILSVIGGFL